jgi:predicted DNA-binding transcriptional regulator YafY
LTTLGEVKAILQQFKGFSHFEEVGDMINRLEDKIYTSKTKQPSVIEFEKNERLTGLEYLDVLHRAVVAKEPLKITYQSFKARAAQQFIFHAYLLKEYRNRWFVLGKVSAEKPTMTLALDRIKAVENAAHLPFLENHFFDAQTYFKDIIGVTKSENIAPEVILFALTAEHAPYNITKPLHHSQEIVEKRADGSIVFKILVQINFELERELLGFGEYLQVIAPRRLKGRIKSRLKKMVEIYDLVENDE